MESQVTVADIGSVDLRKGFDAFIEAARRLEQSYADLKARDDAVDLELAELTDLVTELVDLATDVRNEEALAPVTLAELAAPVVERARLSIPSMTARSERSSASSGPTTWCAAWPGASSST